MKMFNKDKKKKMSDNEMSAKQSVLEHLRNEAEGMMGEKMKGMKKVTVASNSSEGLKKGLDKAEEIISGKEQAGMVQDAEDGELHGHDALQGGDEDGAEEAHEEAAADPRADEMDEDELDAKLAELMAKKERLKMKKM